MKHLRPLFFTLLVLAFTVLPTFALEETPANEGTPTGLIWLFFGGGLFAILVIGGILYARESAGQGEGEHTPNT
jgi:hypothetical protein